MAGKAGQGSQGKADRLGFASGAVVQEWGYDDDADAALRAAIEDLGAELVDEDYDDISDAALVWWRADDGDGADLEDLLVDVISSLDEGGGLVWLLVPKAGNDGHVAAYVVEEAARTAGLQPTSSLAAAPGWLGTRLVAKGRR